MGAYPLPKGFNDISEVQAGCRHAVGIKPSAQRGSCANYELGLIESKKFPGTYTLAYDFWSSSLKEKVGGEKCENLMMHYQVEAVKNLAKSRGHFFSEQRLPDGRIKVTTQVQQTLAVRR